MDAANENTGTTKRSGIKPPSTFSNITSSPTRALGELHEAGANARSGMPIPTAKHKPSGLPEPAFKQRKTLAEQAGEPISRLKPPPSKISSGIKSIVPRGLAASTSRATTKPTARHPAASTLSGSVGGAPKASGAVRPKSAYGHGSHARSKSYQQGPRPTTAMLNRDDDDDSEQAERKDFYNERMEAMERDFRMFKEKMETDVRQATDYKESIQQLQSRVTELETIRARLEIVNKGLESELDDTRSCLKSVKMELEMMQQKHTYEVEDVRRRLRIEVEDLESRHRKDTDRMERERDEVERKTRLELEGRIDKLLKEHDEELAGLRKKLDADTETERSRRVQEAQKIEEEYGSKLRAAAMEADAKHREAQLVQGELTNVKSELDRERMLKNSLQVQLTEATSNNLTLDAANKAMKEKIDFLESDSQAQSQAFNDLHKRMQDAIEAAERAQDKLRQEETLRRKLFNQVQELKGNIRVMCRVRPAHETERNPAQISFPDNDTDSKEVAVLGPSKQSATGKDITSAYAYSFDRVFGPASQNSEVFEEISQLVQSALDGYNVCIFCYGQTGAGKTHTMSSADGMIPRATAQIWDEAQRLQEKGWKYEMEGSFLEVYNETYNDLLGRSEDLDKKKVEVRHDAAKKQTNLDGAVSVKLDGPGRVEEILATADKNRTVAATKANMRSSRSHSVFILKLVGTNEITGERSEGTLNLVDLAGSERLEHSKAEGARLKETQNINKSLSCLGDVINALGSAKEGTHVPYRNSKLTYLLQYSLGGNSKTLMFVMVSPLQAHLQETITSLKFATKVYNTHIGTAKKQTKTS
ncbi:kinesin-domain-containing protein [Alternaria alternata]|uniref:Kinesin-like protein n=1 Tax=Alternaria alternata TaxID=5599 RepID=A0A177E2T3_ALTAL|nr:kinesin-domain-containing protein [Alternaria alternata]OAG26274.1 kinesin-domain-containing protein [Alternaria alternata]